MVLVRGLVWLVGAVVVGLLGGVVGWQIVGDDLAVPDLPKPPIEESVRASTAGPDQALAVILSPIGTGADGVVVPRGGHVDVVIELRNPDSTRYDQLAVDAELLDGRCSWPDGSLASISFLGARSSAERMCRLSLSGDDLGSLTVVARNAGQEVGRARLVATIAPSDAEPPVEVDADGTPLGGFAEPGSVAEEAGPVCPILAPAIELTSSLAVADLGPLVTDRARLLDLTTCPEWSAASLLDLVAGETVGDCAGWSVVSDGVPIGDISPVASERCDVNSGPLYLDITIDEAGPVLAHQVTVLTAWALAGDRDVALAVSATLDRTARGDCDGELVLRARLPYLQDLPDGTTSYRTVLEAC